MNKVDLQTIKLTVERYFGFNLNVRCRERHIVDARKMYFSLCRDFTKSSLMLIGRSMDRDHATALHNIRSCKDLRKTDAEFNEKYIALYRRLSMLKSDSWKFKAYNVPKVIHPGRFLKLGYGKTKSIRKVFNQRGYTPKQRYELY
jgi:hypothetical protein